MLRGEGGGGGAGGGLPHNETRFAMIGFVHAVHSDVTTTLLFFNNRLNSI